MDVYSQSSEIPQGVLVRILALTESDIKNGAGLFSDYHLDEKETLSHFKTMCQDKDNEWNADDLRSFCRTRRLGYCDNKSRHLPVKQLLARIETQLELEAQRGRATCISCPRRSQLPSRKRRLSLVRSGILNVHNCRRLVKVEVPNDTDGRWRCVCARVIV